jgi:ribosomal protein L32
VKRLQFEILSLFAEAQSSGHYESELQSSFNSRSGPDSKQRQYDLAWKKRNRRYLSEYEAKRRRSPGSKLTRCKTCGELGHNSRNLRHTRGKP